ncbi:MAG: hypothetical protein JJE09_14015 [Bacteroidia bacterium]|nr:hypothetical protein [Bacteroidia bacterium]
MDLVKRGIVFSTTDELSPKKAWKLLLNEKRKDQKASVGFTRKVYWLAFTYKNESRHREDKILEIDNPQIDWLNVYAINFKGDEELLATTGDNLLFSSRPINHRNFAIPLSYEPGQAKTILLKIDKRNSSLSFPTYLWTKNAFLEKSLTQHLWLGLFFGIITLCMCYAIMAFIFLRKAIYGWYFLMAFVSAIYLFTALGFSFQYIYPSMMGFNTLVRIYLSVIVIFSTVKFTQHFLNLKEYLPKVIRFQNYLLLFLGVISLVYPFAYDFMTKNGTWFMSLLYLVAILGVVSLVYSAIRCFDKQRTTVAIYFIAWGALLLGYQAIIFSEFGWISIVHLPVNPVLIGTSIEMLIFSVGLTYQVSKVYTERNQLSLSMAKQQKELLKAYVDGTEKERQRISRELHDDIGSRLGSLKRFITDNKGQNQTLENQIDILCNDVRTLSHQLAPTNLAVGDFRQLIEQLLEETSQHEELKTDVQYYDINVLSPETTHHLLRVVQEAIRNVLKHARATQLDLQFFKYENEIVMTIEDNGRGFDPKSNAHGIGLQNMKARTESLNGTIEINSSPGNGTNIMVKIPLEKSV